MTLTNLPMLKAEEMAITRQLASGDRSVAEAARAIYERHVRSWIHGGRVCVAMAFFSEVFSPCPDLLLRASYRRRLLVAAESALTAPASDPDASPSQE